MNKRDAFSILNINAGHVTPSDIKAAYRKATLLYHPDRNPAGLEMMKMINAAYATVKDFQGAVEHSEHRNYSEDLNKALNAIINLGLTIEVCGAWAWVSGNTKPHRETLKAAGYQWAPQKQRWYFRPEGHKSYNRSAWSMEQIRARYGSETLKDEQRQLSAAY
jgi:curved DNA-binding protein CbpA